MKRFPRVFATVVAVALAAALAPISNAVADVGTVKRISCPSIAEVNRALPPSEVNRPRVSMEATPSRCLYWTSDKALEPLGVQFVDGVTTAKVEENRIRVILQANEVPPSYLPRPLPSLGKDAFYMDHDSSLVYWQFSPGAVTELRGLGGGESLVRVAKLFKPMMEVYTIAGERTVNGRKWRTTCESYSATARCRTDIFATTITKTPTGYSTVNAWVFNSLTYRWSDRALWKNNPLGRTGQWTSTDGRKWRTECDTTTTGRGACRSYIWTTEISRKDGKYISIKAWKFNNQVLFNN